MDLIPKEKILFLEFYHLEKANHRQGMRKRNNILEIFN